MKTDSNELRADLDHTKRLPVLELPGLLQSCGTWNAVLNYERSVWRNDLSTHLKTRLALKVGYATTSNNRPASRGMDLVQTGSESPMLQGQTSV